MNHTHYQNQSALYSADNFYHGISQQAYLSSSSSDSDGEDPFPILSDPFDHDSDEDLFYLDQYPMEAHSQPEMRVADLFHQKQLTPTMSNEEGLDTILITQSDIENPDIDLVPQLKEQMPFNF